MKYSIKAQDDGQSADIHINDFIGDWIDNYWGFGVTSKQFIEDVQRLPDSVNLVRMHISTPGGDVTAAHHIANMIRDQQSKGRTFEALVTAAFSAGTIITSAAKMTRIADNGLMMIHDPWTVAVGNARDLRKAADVTDKFRDSIIAAYKWKSPLSAKKLSDMMAEETWMDASDAIGNGFADSMMDSVQVSALFDPSVLAKLPTVPERFRERVQALLKPVSESEPDPVPPADPPVQEPSPAPAPEGDGTSDDPPTPEIGPEPASDAQNRIELVEADAATLRAEAAEIVKLCNKYGLPAMAATLLAKGARLAEVKDRFKHADDIRSRCAAAKMPERAANYIYADMSPEEVGDHLLKLQQALDAPEIDNKQPAAGADSRKYTINPWVIAKRYQDKEKSFGRKL